MYKTCIEWILILLLRDSFYIDQLYFIELLKKFEQYSTVFNNFFNWQIKKNPCLLFFPFSKTISEVRRM